MVLDAEKRHHGDQQFGGDQQLGQPPAAPFLGGKTQDPNESEPPGNENEEDDRRNHILDAMAAVLDASGDDRIYAIGQAEQAQGDELYQCGYGRLVSKFHIIHYATPSKGCKSSTMMLV